MQVLCLFSVFRYRFSIIEYVYFYEGYKISYSFFIRKVFYLFSVYWLYRNYR